MTEHTTGPTTGPTSDETRSSDEIEKELERTREDLGRTVEALAAKLDVKQRSAAWTRETWAAHSREIVFVGATAAALVVGLVVRKVRR
jgi:hypothetical protein